MNGRSLWQLSLDWLLAIVAVLGSVLTLTTNPSFLLPTPALLLVLVPLVGMILCLLFTPKWGGAAALGVLGFLLLTGFLLRRELLESFRNLWGTLSFRYALGYDLVRDYLPREPWSPRNSEAALTTLALAETYLVCLSVRRWKRVTPGALALLLCVAPCFVLTDTPPKLLPLLTTVFSLLTQAFSQSVRRRGAGEEGRAVALSALAAAGLLGLLLLLFPQKDYSQPFTWDQLSQRMRQWTQEQNNRGNINAGLAGNPSEVDLSALRALPNQPIPVLNVSSNESARIYLRGASYSHFDGTRWSRGPEWEGSDTVLYPYVDAANVGGATLTVSPQVEEPVLFTTYQLLTLPSGGHPVGDAYLARDGNARRGYTMRYARDLPPLLPDADYNAWVRAHDLELPDRVRAGLQAWWDQHARRTDFSDNAELARYAAELVSQCAVYSRTPDRMPEGADFCSWFLNEAEKGYCVHFASCCAALLRSMGVPARYVTGYICSTQANRTIQVSSLQAHAWVEIYDQGRWIPVEPTPDDATEFTGLAEPGGPGTLTEPVGPGGTESPSVTAPARTEAPTETQAPTRPAATEAPSTEPAPSGQPSQADSGFWKLLLNILLWALRILALPALMFGRRRLVLRLRADKLAQAQTNEKALLLYRRLLRLRRHSKARIPQEQEAERLAKKACFSQHTLEEKELDFLRFAVAQHTQVLTARGFWLRLWYKYVLILI